MLIRPIVNENQNSNNEIENFITAFKEQAVKQGFDEQEIEQMIKKVTTDNQ